tara:strand:+ start:6832 stop:7317 length:486 start_codon:yes stop_codon:yes gene_type:complete
MNQEYAAWKKLVNLRLVRYYVYLIQDIQHVFYILNIVDSNKHTITLNALFQYIDRIEDAARRVIQQANIQDASSKNIFMADREYFCRQYANYAVDNIKSLCISLDNFYDFVQVKFKKDREKWRDLKKKYEQKIQSMIKYMNVFSANIQKIYEQDCQDSDFD